MCAKKLKDLFKSMPMPSDLTGKSLIMKDADGKQYAMDAELEWFKFKCRCLFGTDKVYIVRRAIYNNVYSLVNWKNYTNSATGWGFGMSNSSEGDIAVIIATSSEGKSVALYAKGTNQGADNNRLFQGLLLEAEGYRPYWSSSLATL